MKSIVMPVQDGNEKGNNKLTSDNVKETLAPEAIETKYKQLTSADMWNLQRKSRSASDLVRRWNLN